MRVIFAPSPVGLPGSVGLLLVRLAVGAAFVLHGWGKIQNPLHWMGEGTPAPMQAIAAVSEFGGGIAVLVGFLTRLGALGIAATMVGAMVLYHIPAGNPFVSNGGPSYELVAIYSACAVLLMLVGPGRLSADAYAFRPKSWWRR